MDIELTEITVKDIFKGYSDKGEDGVFAYDGKLSIRPAYQREYVYSKEQAEAVIHTILKRFPLNIMYWAKADDGTYELLDGQQRTLSVMQYLDHKYDISINGTKFYWDSLSDERYKTIMDYKFMIYICEGTNDEKLDWFDVVNTGGLKLTPQELNNSIYTGTWLTDAKRYFSKINCVAKKLGGKFINGDPNRQELLEKALKGICDNQNIKNITTYMSAHQNDDDADELWQYFQDVIGWVEKIFPMYYSDMKGLDWCHLFNKYHNNTYNSTKMNSEVKTLHEDDEIGKTKGIYEYLLCRDSDPYAGRFLDLRTFDKKDALAAFSKQNGVCPICGQTFKFEEMQADHIKPWSKGGHTTKDNCQMLCRDCNSKKSAKY